MQITSTKVFVLFVILFSAVSCRRQNVPPPVTPPQTARQRRPSYPVTPPVTPTARPFNVCADRIARLPMRNLDEILASPGQTPAEISNTAAGIALTARDYRNRYWDTKDLNDGIFALRFFDGYLTLSPPKDSLTPFYLLESIAIYCDIGCRGKANELAVELGSYTFETNNLIKALGYCKAER